MRELRPHLQFIIIRVTPAERRAGAGERRHVNVRNVRQHFATFLLISLACISAACHLRRLYALSIAYVARAAAATARVS